MTVMLDVMRNANIDRLDARNATDEVFANLHEFTAGSNVTSVATTLKLPTFFSTSSSKAILSSPLLIGETVKQLRSEELVVIFGAREREFSVHLIRTVQVPASRSGESF